MLGRVDRLAVEVVVHAVDPLICCSACSWGMFEKATGLRFADSHRALRQTPTTRAELEPGKASPWVN